MSWIKIVQIVIAILLMLAILLQSRGSGLSVIFGGGSGGVYRARRGLEKILFAATVVLAVLFLAIALLGMILSNKI